MNKNSRIKKLQNVFKIQKKKGYNQKVENFRRYLETGKKKKVLKFKKNFLIN